MSRRAALALSGAVALAAALGAFLVLRREPPEPPASGGAPVLWRDPGKVAELDFAGGPGGANRVPRAPFSFLSALSEGRSPKLRVLDASGRSWVVKWGPEAKAECFATRVAWAAGYFTQPTYLVRSGVIDGVSGNERPAPVDAAGRFADGRFELWESRFHPGPGWNWDRNPFSGTRELAGLKVVMMLVSNWDAKDAREGSGNSNTAIVDVPVGTVVEARYLVSDWGSTMGEWGRPFFYRDAWNCPSYTQQTNGFVGEVRDDVVDWGFASTHDLTGNIRVADVAWIASYLGRIRDAQLDAALQACGATREETDCFRKAVRSRIEQLRRVAPRKTG